MQVEQIESIVSEIKKYDKSFDLVHMLQKKLDNLKYRDSIKETDDGKLALFLEKYLDKFYLEYYPMEPKIYMEIPMGTNILDALTGFSTLSVTIDKYENSEKKYHLVSIYPKTKKFLDILKQLDCTHTIKIIGDHTAL